jgi:hypothetical protein
MDGLGYSRHFARLLGAVGDKLVALDLPGAQGKQMRSRFGQRTPRLHNNDRSAKRLMTD